MWDNRKVSGNIFKNNLISNLPSYEISKLGIGLVPEGRRIFQILLSKKT